MRVWLTPEGPECWDRPQSVREGERWGREGCYLTFGQLKEIPGLPGQSWGKLLTLIFLSWKTPSASNWFLDREVFEEEYYQLDSQLVFFVRIFCIFDSFGRGKLSRPIVSLVHFQWGLILGVRNELNIIFFFRSVGEMSFFFFNQPKHRASFFQCHLIPSGVWRTHRQVFCKLWENPT